MMLADRNKCTGCMSCYNICARDAIKMESDNMGFLHPVIDINNCVECGMCEKSCPVLMGANTNNVHTKEVYAAWNRDEKVRKDSSSGGIFFAIAEYILEKQGIVIGAGFDDNMHVVQTAIESKSDIWKLQGSKYVQSYVGDMYRVVKNNLALGRMVLFVGTPCQVAGLKKFLGNYDKGMLRTIDLVCHGAPSPKILREYFDYVEEKYKGNVRQVLFRDKKYGWKKYSMSIKLDNGKKDVGTYTFSPYLNGFMKDLYLREACYQCEYASLDRYGDLTLGDFWGYKSQNQNDIDDDKGISFVLVNSIEGKEILENIKNKIVYFARNIDDVKIGNPSLYMQTKEPADRRFFLKEYKDNGFNYVLDKYMKKEPTLKEKIALKCPKFVKKILKGKKTS